MNWFLWYLIGLMTLPVSFFTFYFVHQMLSRNKGIECGTCGTVLGEIDKDLVILTNLRYLLHIARYRSGFKTWRCTPKH